MSRYRVDIPANLNPKPSPIELDIARILSEHYQTSVEFLIPSKGYKQKTPDIVMNGLMWEIKSPTGSSVRHTIEKQIRKALKQSENIIIDIRNTKFKENSVIQECVKHSSNHKKINRLLLVSKYDKVIDIYKRR